MANSMPHKSLISIIKQRYRDHLVDTYDKEILSFLMVIAKTAGVLVAVLYVIFSLLYTTIDLIFG